MTTPREKFQTLLKKLFQFDNAELDFGIYRIMNHKRTVIERFIESDLIKGLDEELKRGAHAEEADLARRLEEGSVKIRENFGDDAVDTEGSGFHPDFILWVTEGDKQRLVFVEPHGILNEDHP